MLKRIETVQQHNNKNKSLITNGCVELFKPNNTKQIETWK